MYRNNGNKTSGGDTLFKNETTLRLPLNRHLLSTGYRYAIQRDTDTGTVDKRLQSAISIGMHAFIPPFDLGMEDAIQGEGSTITA